MPARRRRATLGAMTTTDHDTGFWAAAWLGAAALGVANGVARDTPSGRLVGERAAHHVSTATLLGALRR